MGFLNRKSKKLQESQKVIEFLKKQINMLDVSGNVLLPSDFLQKYSLTSNSITNYMTLAYGSNAHVYSVVKYIADKTSSLPLLNEDELINKYFLNDVITSLEVTGNCFIEKETAETYSGTQRLSVLNPSSVEILSNSIGSVIGYKYTNLAGIVNTFEKDDIIHIRYSNLVSTDTAALWGMSPLMPGSATYQASNNINKAEAAIFDNFGATGILTNDTDVPILESEREGKQKRFELKTVGTSKFGKTLLSNHKLRYIQIGMSPTALKIVETNISKLRTICSIYGVSSLLFNDHVASTRDNLLLADTNFIVNKSIPLLEYILKILNKELMLNIEVNYDDIDQLSKVNKEYSDRIINEVNAGIITRAKAYELLGYEGQYKEEDKGQGEDNKRTKAD